MSDLSPVASPPLVGYAAAPAPQKLGRYELLHPIASGGMATVYLGRAAGIGGFERLVAIKICHPHLGRDADFAAMFLDEARLAARIHHPNVVPVLDVGDEGGLFFVMEYVEGVSLADLLKTQRRLPPPVVARIGFDMLAGLHAAHELKGPDGRRLHLVHRDVSPQNVLVGTDGTARIVDFGVAKAEARATVTKGGEVKGKIGYMPPEQFLGQPVTRQADVYAAGVVLWECLAGERLFAADSEAAVMNMVLRGMIRALPAGEPAVPAALEQVLQRALATSVSGRFDTAEAFAQSIESLGLPVASRRDVGVEVERAAATWLAERRRLVQTVTTRLSARGRAVPPSATLIARLASGQVLVLPRRWVMLAAATAAVSLAAWALWPSRTRDAPAPTPVSESARRDGEAVARPPPPAAQSLSAAPPAVERAPAAAEPKRPEGARKGTRPRARPARFPRAQKAPAPPAQPKPPEFRPTEL